MGDEHLPEGIAALLRTGRIRKGWKQSELAEHAGVSRTTLIHLERGATQEPHAATLSKLAHALDIPPEQFVAAQSIEVAREQTDFDRQSNPALAEAAERYPQRFRHLTPADWAELAGQFGVGGGLTVEGALAAVDRLQSDKDTLHKLKLVLQTHLREPAQQLIEALYRSVEVTRDPTSPRGCTPAASEETVSHLTPDT